MMKWKVVETCYTSKFEKPFDREVAQIDTLGLAEEFMNLVLPKDTRERFRMEHL